MKSIKKIYGPYQNRETREFVIVYYDDGSKKSISYPKFLVEQSLGVDLGENLTIDHIDRNFHKNNPNNLRIIELNDHLSQDALRVMEVEYTCIWCKNKFESKSKSRVDGKRKGKAGPFCSKKCIGLYGSSLQNNKIKRLSNLVEDESREYFHIEKTGGILVSSIISKEEFIDLDNKIREKHKQIKNNKLSNKIFKRIRITKYCKMCNKTLNNSQKFYCSDECNHLNQRRVERPTKEELEKLVWQYSMLQLGKMYGVSDNAVRKWCKSYGIVDLPTRGYWRKLETGNL